MKFIIYIIRIVFFPVWLISNLIYDDSPPIIVGYSWYTKKNYLDMITNAQDDLDSLLSFEQWKENAERRIGEMEKSKWIVFRVKIDSYRMIAWMKKNELSNTSENREYYVNYRLQDFLKNPAI